MKRMSNSYNLISIFPGIYFRHIFSDMWGFSTGGLSPGISGFLVKCFQFHSSFSYKLKGGDKMDYEIEPVVEETGIEPVKFYFHKEIRIFGFWFTIEIIR